MPYLPGYARLLRSVTIKVAAVDRHVMDLQHRDDDTIEHNRLSSPLTMLKREPRLYQLSLRGIY